MFGLLGAIRVAAVAKQPARPPTNVRDGRCVAQGPGKRRIHPTIARRSRPEWSGRRAGLDSGETVDVFSPNTPARSAAFPPEIHTIIHAPAAPL
jgi:hypothetical protein